MMTFNNQDTPKLRPTKSQTIQIASGQALQMLEIFRDFQISDTIVIDTIGDRPRFCVI